jgi:hypothetical protein
MADPKLMCPSDRMRTPNRSGVAPRKSDPYSKMIVSSTGGAVVLNQAVMVLGALPPGRARPDAPRTDASVPLNATAIDRFPGTQAAVPVSFPDWPFPLVSDAVSP